MDNDKSAEYNGNVIDNNNDNIIVHDDRSKNLLLLYLRCIILFQIPTRFVFLLDYTQLYKNKLIIIEKFLWYVFYFLFKDDN
jgi:hypothetical protein